MTACIDVFHQDSATFHFLSVKIQRLLQFPQKSVLLTRFGRFQQDPVNFSQIRQASFKKMSASPGAIQ